MTAAAKAVPRHQNQIQRPGPGTECPGIRLRRPGEEIKRPIGLGAGIPHLPETVEEKVAVLLI